MRIQLRGRISVVDFILFLRTLYLKRIKLMQDLFRAIFGAPPYDHFGKRMDETPPNEYRDNYTRNSGDDMGDDDDDEMGMNPPGFFGFSVFNDPSSINRQFEKFVNEMNKAFGMFGFDSNSSITFEDENRNMSPSNGAPCQRPENLRDLYLKQPEGVSNPNNLTDHSVININMNAGSSGNLMAEGTIFKKSIFIQKFQRPDGSVEIIQKVLDHKGNEETTITHSNINDPLLPPPPPPPPQDNQPKPENSSGLSLLRKFFSF